MQLAVGYTGFLFVIQRRKGINTILPSLRPLQFYYSVVCSFFLLSFVYFLTLHSSFIGWNISVSYIYSFLAYQFLKTLITISLPYLVPRPNREPYHSELIHLKLLLPPLYPFSFPIFPVSLFSFVYWPFFLLPNISKSPRRISSLSWPDTQQTFNKYLWRE